MTAPVAQAAKISAKAPYATAAFSAGLEAGTDSACGIEKAEAMRASEASTAEARSVFKAAFAIARRAPSQRRLI